jgi:hypothetical protein
MENVKDINIMEINVKVNARVLVIIVVFVLEMILVKNVQMESILVKSAKKYVINVPNLYVIFMEFVMILLQIVQIIISMEMIAMFLVKI